MVDMMREGRIRYIQYLLDLTYRYASFAGAYQFAYDFQSCLISELAKLGCRCFVIKFHDKNIIQHEQIVNYISRKIEIMI